MGRCKSNYYNVFVKDITQLSKQYNEVDMNTDDSEKVFDLFWTAPQIYKITKFNI